MYFTDFQKEVMRKLQLLLNKMNGLENRMVLLEASSIKQHNNEQVDDIVQYEEYELPLKDIQALKRFEGLLQDNSFANKMVK